MTHTIATLFRLFQILRTFDLSFDIFVTCNIFCAKHVAQKSYRGCDDGVKVTVETMSFAVQILMT